jgi:hypothetical protein
MGCGASTDNPPLPAPRANDNKKTTTANNSNLKNQSKKDNKEVKQSSSKPMSQSKVNNSKMNNSKSTPKTNTSNIRQSNIKSSRAGTGASEDRTKSEDKSMRESTRSFNKSTKHLEVSPSKAKANFH